VPQNPEELMEYSAMLTELMTEYPEYKDMTLEEISEDMGIEEGLDIDLAQLDQEGIIPPPPGEELLEEEDEELPLF